MTAYSWRAGVLGALVTTAAAMCSTVVPDAVAAEPQDYLHDEIGVGFFTRQ